MYDGRRVRSHVGVGGCEVRGVRGAQAEGEGAARILVGGLEDGFVTLDWILLGTFEETHLVSESNHHVFIRDDIKL